MNISARNVLQGSVHSLLPGRIHTRVLVDLAGGGRLAAVVATEGCGELGLAPGRPVVALVKASWVMVMPGDGRGAGLAGCSCLAGTVASVLPGPVNAELRLTLASGAEVVAVVTPEAVRELGLSPGTPATAVIPASHVVLARPCAG